MWKLWREQSDYSDGTKIPPRCSCPGQQQLVLPDLATFSPHLSGGCLPWICTHRPQPQLAGCLSSIDSTPWQPSRLPTILSFDVIGFWCISQGWEPFSEDCFTSTDIILKCLWCLFSSSTKVKMTMEGGVNIVPMNIDSRFSSFSSQLWGPKTTYLLLSCFSSDKIGMIIVSFRELHDHIQWFIANDKQTQWFIIQNKWQYLPFRSLRGKHCAWHQVCTNHSRVVKT